MVTVAKLVSAIVATAAETMGGPSFLEYPIVTPTSRAEYTGKNVKKFPAPCQTVYKTPLALGGGGPIAPIHDKKSMWRPFGGAAKAQAFNAALERFR
jgi:hypothetical protein